MDNNSIDESEIYESCLNGTTDSINNNSINDDRNNSRLLIDTSGSIDSDNNTLDINNINSNTSGVELSLPH